VRVLQRPVFAHSHTRSHFKLECFDVLPPAGHDPDHVHGDGCGHPKVSHDDHFDFVVSSFLHHVHDGHCDHHGEVRSAANAVCRLQFLLCHPSLWATNTKAVPPHAVGRAHQVSSVMFPARSPVVGPHPQPARGFKSSIRQLELELVQPLMPVRVPCASSVVVGVSVCVFVHARPSAPLCH
jgi:hypothetical protein